MITTTIDYRFRFARKTYGRIFVRSDEDIDGVVGIVREVDSFEADYMPSTLVTTYKVGEPNRLVYLHKFEICKIELTRACLAKGIWIWCVDGMREGETV